MDLNTGPLDYEASSNHAAITTAQVLKQKSSIFRHIFFIQTVSKSHFKHFSVRTESEGPALLSIPESNIKNKN